MTSDKQLRNYLAGNCNVDSSAIDSLISQTTNTSPWYTNLLIISSAWLGSILIVGGLLFSLMNVLLEDKVGMSIGLFIVVATVILSRNKEFDRENIFLEQMLAACNLIGLGIFLGSAIPAFKGNFPEIILIIGIIQALIVPVFPIKTAQFLGTLISIAAFDIFVTARHSFFVFEIMTTLVCFSSFLFLLKKSELVGRLGADAYYAINSALLLASLYLLHINSIMGVKEMRFPFILLLFGGCINWYLIKTYIKQINISYYVALGFIVVVGLITYRYPGILATIGFVILCFSKGQTTNLKLSIISLAALIFYLYYSLQYTLLQKSISLMILGGFLLIAAAIYSKRGVLSAN